MGRGGPETQGVCSLSHRAIGKMDTFAPSQLEENLLAFTAAVVKAKPEAFIQPVHRWVSALEGWEGRRQDLKPFFFPSSTGIS